MVKKISKTPSIAFFGTPDRAVWVLDVLKNAGMTPSLIITQPDRPQGRKLIVTPPPVKVWAQRENIPFIQPESLSDEGVVKTLRDGVFDLFVVVAYGKIMSQTILDIPKHGSLNLHASLLPRLRGSCPIESAIVHDEKNTGVTITLMDNLMDHGPILAAKQAELPTWPLPADELAKILVNDGAHLLVDVIPRYIKGEITPVEQNHEAATYTKKLSKEDGLIDPAGDSYSNFLKYNAYKTWPTVYFFMEVGGKKTRVTITDASYENGAFTINKVIPEGKKEMPFQDYKASVA